MKFDLRRPCPGCPFRTDVEPYLRTGRVGELEDALLRQQSTFSCHKTVDYGRAESEDDPDDDQIAHYRPDAGEQHCAGALILLEKLERPNQMMRVCERLGAYDRTKLDMAAPVYDSFAAMKAATRKANARKAAR
jgi:hypothetical protein